ncbi:cytochrome P450 [Nesterenkonia natronophila]|uniref:Cytochrome P450 n=1 Tax=Nesterenkonia natronophila TaxID=2174932 RepID=A0A3A4F4W4_9MICC|nr:cytochrome P450 [Nesterenkonia natronophila]RJN32928.1 cytochrome P450 [Nesterenkonia natronophila]
MPTTADTVPYLDISASDFAMASEAVRDARDAHWYARTNYGIAVLSYEDVSTLMKSPRMIQGSAKWPQHHGVHDGLFHDWWAKNLLVLEGEDHHRIRRLANPAFSPRKIKALGDRFDELANELIDQWIDSGEVEFVEGFAAPFATRVLCIMLGIDEDEWPTINRLASTVGAALGVNIKAEIQEIDAALEELHRYADQLISDRQQNPKDDFVTRLVDASRDGDSLSDAQLQNLLVLLIFGGMDTTRNQLGLAMQSFIRQPHQWELLASRPEELAEAAVEESLRVNPTTRWVTREVVDTFQHKDLTFHPGDTVHMFTYASGTDPEVFSDPTRINLEAERKPHYAFGGGVHHCLGHFVARSDMQAALPALATRITNLGIVEGGDEWMPDSGNTGPVRLKIAFDKREASETAQG